MNLKSIIEIMKMEIHYFKIQAAITKIGNCGLNKMPLKLK